METTPPCTWPRVAPKSVQPVSAVAFQVPRQWTVPSALWCTKPPPAFTVAVLGVNVPEPVTWIQSPGAAIIPPLGATAVLGVTRAKAKAVRCESAVVVVAAAALAGTSSARIISAVPPISVSVRRMCHLRGRPGRYPKHHAAPVRLIGRAESPVEDGRMLPAGAALWRRRPLVVFPAQPRSVSDCAGLGSSGRFSPTGRDDVQAWLHAGQAMSTSMSTSMPVPTTAPRRTRRLALFEQAGSLAVLPCRLVVGTGSGVGPATGSRPGSQRRSFRSPGRAGGGPCVACRVGGWGWSAVGDEGRGAGGIVTPGGAEPGGDLAFLGLGQPGVDQHQDRACGSGGRCGGVVEIARTAPLSHATPRGCGLRADRADELGMRSVQVIR